MIDKFGFKDGKKPLCGSPFNTRDAKPDGYHICCSQLSEPFPNVEDWWSSDIINEHREKMFEYDTLPEYCKECMSYGELSDQKYFEYEALEEHPRTIQILMSNKCNLACRMCYGKNSKTYMDLYDIEDTYDYKQLDFSIPKGVETVVLYGGEPFMDKRTIDVLKEVLEDTKAEVFILTNGTVLHTPLAKKILAICKEYKHRIVFTISCDGGKERNEYIRQNIDHDLMLANVPLLKEHSKHLCMHHTLSRMSYDTIYDFIQVAEKAQVFVDFGTVKAPREMSIKFMDPQIIKEAMQAQYKQMQTMPEGYYKSELYRCLKEMLSVEYEHRPEYDVEFEQKMSYMDNKIAIKMVN
ncbi:radical SAM domain-containing protein [Vibrio phage F86]